MSRLVELVSIDRRFARSARLDTDLCSKPALAGYVMQASVQRALISMAAGQAESGQGAYTWTGPYGGGKSSAALLIANLVAGTEGQRRTAEKIAGVELTQQFKKAFPRSSPWSVVAVTGSRKSLNAALADAAMRAFDWPETTTARALADKELIELIAGESAKRGGLLILLDELGKMLEHEAANGGDAHLLQDLAERASRSSGKLVVVGILHQSFDQYAERSARDTRKEWAKVQGRFQDIAFLTAVDETVALLGRAIQAKSRPAYARVRASIAAAAVARRRPADAPLLASLLETTWPLNPVATMLLGPVSRQRFAQNERSVFGFLSSAEPGGFQEFLAEAMSFDRTYDPSDLWDYLAANFGMALASGADGSRFSLAFDAIQRAAARGNELHVKLTKAAAMIEFFRNGSGVALADDFLGLSVPWAGAKEVQKATNDLVDWAILIRQPRLGGYALFAGSDFDLEAAIDRATAPLDAEEMAAVPARAGFASIAAKRHYFETGALRTFDVTMLVATRDEDREALAQRALLKRGRGAGAMVLLLGDGHLSNDQLDRRCTFLAARLARVGVVGAVGASPHSFKLRSDAEELFAMERVLRDHPQLEGDRIARREISARLSVSIDRLHRSLEAALESARWRPTADPKRCLTARPSVVASEVADAAFPKAPVLKSELLQRERPSSNAMAALRNLCHAMVGDGHAEGLGIEGFPAEMGLYLTVIRPYGVHDKVSEGHFEFRDPDREGQGATLWPAWNVLTEVQSSSLDEVFDTWSEPPFGMKLGIMAPLALAFLLAHRDTMAIYVDDVFQSDMDDLFVDRLLQKPAAIRLRRIDRTVTQTAFMSELAKMLNEPGDSGALIVAKALFKRFSKLPQYARRSAAVGLDAVAIRDTVIKAKDPEALLFDDLPALRSDGRISARDVYSAVQACEECYPNLLTDLRVALARSLGTRDDFHGLSIRAEAIRGLTNDYAFDAFVMRAAAFDGDLGDIEGLASVLVHKPAASWSDRDREQAFIELARFGRRFREAEALASVCARRSNTEALALVVGIDPLIPPFFRSFELTEEEKTEAAALAEEVLGRLSQGGHGGRLRLAALARAVATLSGETV